MDSTPDIDKPILDKNEKTRWYHWLDLFFLNFFWLGLIVLLIAIICEHCVGATPTQIQSVGIDLLQSMGIAILVATIFTFASGTSQFISKVRSLLENIVISRDFLSNIDTRSKRDALASLLKPSVKDRTVYANIDGYFETYISRTMDIINKNVRSNYVATCRVYYDTDLNKVVIEECITYRLYPNENGYGNLSCQMYDYEDEAVCDFMIVNTPMGKRKVFKDELEAKDTLFKGERVREFSIDLKEIGNNCTHLDIEVKIREFGDSHWALLTFQTLQPTDGIKIAVRCEDGLVIKKHDEFIYGSFFHLDEPSNKELTLTCTQWVNEGAGVAMVIAKPDGDTKMRSLTKAAPEKKAQKSGSKKDNSVVEAK